MKVCIVYGSTTGSTEGVAKRIAANFAGAEIFPASELRGPISCDLLILGASTWGLGDLQDDMVGFIQKYSQVPIAANFGAVFGLGSQTGFPDSFVDGIENMAKFLEKRNIPNIGEWVADGLDFSSSRAQLPDGRLMGLALDEDNQADKTDKRISQWIAHLKKLAGAL